MQPQSRQSYPWWPLLSGDKGTKKGFRHGDKGTHSSRTLMLDELSGLLEATSEQATRSEYASAIIDSNCLSKPTTSTRRLTNQRLGELYALDLVVPIFRVLRRLWQIDEAGRPLLALLAALSRDPLLRATATPIVSLQPGAELQRQAVRESLRAVVGSRLNDSILDKVVRNASSSWSQSGHLEGRTFKIRRQVTATPAAVAFALYLADAVGFHGREHLSSKWLWVLDCTPSSATDLALNAKRLGLIDLRIAGEVWELRLDRLDPFSRRT